MKTLHHVNRSMLLAFVLATLLVVGCSGESPLGTEPESSESFSDGSGNPTIIGGQPDVAHTNVGALVTFNPFIPGNPLMPLCSGTLIAESVVVTAAHCAFFIVSFGLPAWVTFDQQFSENASLIPAIAIPHPNFSPSSNPNDVSGIGGDRFELGVLVLDEPVTDLAPAMLPPEGLLDDLKKQKALRAGDEFTVVGYGASGFADGQPLVDGQRRAADVPFGSLIGEAIQFSNPHNAASACFGDSGGPNFLDVDGQQVLTSVTWWLGNVRCSSWHRAYRLDIPQARKFLENYVDLP